ncbi:mannose-1-phosphate guanylyltransferase [Rubellicoccus peritrichatus]|uniref:mannose-1-phosphate guanylyltransferase n=1 Tax=Rubellicoccus peritrichatus TaxID=3080537 RepID=A0AAQ3QVF1_9BACT|nr:mannose-1-phosphate guanylyltransferase [Puniceicoccus sp. CR14]WOO41538.1 mannose-1-phosphate guanylyltransferase [Puniceicoccus sp. CR14]
MANRYVVIMAGGKGERFWPQSRLKRPKQLLPIVGEKPLLTQTVDRLTDLVPPENILIVTNEEQKAAVIDVCPMLPEANIIGEPVGRDTAAAVGLSMVLVKQRDPEGVFAMLPADHVIHDDEGFKKIVAASFEAAEKDSVLVTIGIRPDNPATGYGYIHRGDVWAEIDGRTVYHVKEFKEKPDAATAQSYLDSGEYYWNAGMFIWSVAAISAAFAEFTPGLNGALEKIDDALTAGQPLADVLNEQYPSLEKISIDYAVMENARNVVTMESAFDWDDVGEWPAVARHFDPDGEGNVVKGHGMVHGGGGNIVISPEGHLTAIVGVDDLIVVRTDDATLICPKSKAQDIKHLVKKLADHPDWKQLT